MAAFSSTATPEVAASSSEAMEGLWAHHHAEWRDPRQVVSQWDGAGEVEPRLLEYRVTGEWWEALAATNNTLLIGREYEHLLLGASVPATGQKSAQGWLTYLRLPHPSGIAINHERGIVHIASTRNPNQIVDLVPITGAEPRLDMDIELPGYKPLVPISTRFYPGCLYIHDLAMIGGSLYANAVGQNAVVKLGEGGNYQQVWWPHCIDTPDGPVFGRNHLQLNSIAAGVSPETSFYSASADHISARRPGHRNFPVERRGVIFSGATREPIARELTRPHSARLHQDRMWVDNSGYGEFCEVVDGQVVTVARLPGWTRGLFLTGNTAFVGTSRVIPRFRQYAPGLEVDKSICAIHALDIQTGNVLGSLEFPYGNQIFAIEGVPRNWSGGFPFSIHGKRSRLQELQLFYASNTSRRSKIGG